MQKSLVGEVVAGAAAAAALDERRRAEVLEARPRAGEQLPAALGPGGRVLEAKGRESLSDFRLGFVSFSGQISEYFQDKF